MSELQEIDLFIDTEGRLRVEVRGVKGAACEELTREMEELLGGEVLERDHTDEFHEQPIEQEAGQSNWSGQG